MSCGDCNVGIAIHVALKVAIVTLCVPPLSPLPQSSSSCSATKSPRCPISNARSAPQPSSPSSANSNCSITCPAIPIGVVSTPSLPSPVLMPSLLDEQQRRLYAGLESLRLGRGGDSRLAALLGLDVHTVARGRQQLLEQQALSGRVRQPGGGRKPTEKKRPES